MFAPTRLLLGRDHFLETSESLKIQPPSCTALPLTASVAAVPVSGHCRVFQELHPSHSTQSLRALPVPPSTAYSPDVGGLGTTRGMTQQGHGTSAAGAHLTENSPT